MSVPHLPPRWRTDSVSSSVWFLEPWRMDTRQSDSYATLNQIVKRLQRWNRRRKSLKKLNKPGISSPLPHGPENRITA